MKKAKYICLEGTEGVGKTTQTQKLVDKLREKGFKVLQTKEPGTPLCPLTMQLRGIMLDNQYDKTLTKPAREFISQAIRSIHLERVIIPNIYDYDYIIQDRGILSGYAYGEACGNHFDDLRLMSARNVESADENHHVLPLTPEHIYDSVIYLRGDSLKGLQKAKSSKQEFDGGDAMESRGDNFIIKVSKNMEQMSLRFKTTTINVENKSIDEVHSEIMKSLGLEKYV